MKFCNENIYETLCKSSMQFVPQTFKKYKEKAERIYLF